MENNNQHTVCMAHGVLEEKVNTNASHVKELQKDVSKLQNEVQDIRERQIKNSEQTITLFKAIDAIEEVTKEMSNNFLLYNEKLETHNEKIDKKIEKSNEKTNEKIEIMDKKMTNQLDKVYAKLEEIKNKKGTWEEVIQEWVKDVLKIAFSGGLIYAILNNIK